MPRTDLLSLSLDDLTALTNRGTVKRAQRELEAGEVKFELNEGNDGTVVVRWTDGVECCLPGGVVLAKGRCSCSAAGLCRHLVRSVLAYQRTVATADSISLVAGPWDPGAIRDEELARHFKPGVLGKIQGQFERGVLVELVRSWKPTARFLGLSCTLRFQVPGDVRYTHCDCAEPAPCSHVPLAVWAFRKLEKDKPAGIVSSQETSVPAPVALLDDIDHALLEGTRTGLAGAARAWRDRLGRLEIRCRDEALAWPAEILAELAQQYDRYHAHDALFNPTRCAELAGELFIRCRALRHDTGAVPRLLIRGSAADQQTELGSARLVGLGCGVHARRRSVELTAYLQDSDSGSVVAVGREFADPADPVREAAKDYWQLARTPVPKGISLAVLGAGQLLIQGGKRSADHRLILGRARTGVNPQGFAWENLRAPVLAEDFAEVRARLGALPPASLRARRVAEDFHVCPVAGVDSARFISAAQTVEAVLRDAHGNQALLSHPYTSRGREGAETLLEMLTVKAACLRFVAGPMRTGASGLTIHPVCLVFQEGPARYAVQPWVDRCKETRERSPLPRNAPTAVGNPVEDYIGQLQNALGELWLTGLRRADATSARLWRELARNGEAMACTRLAREVAALADALERKAHTVDWDCQEAGTAIVNLSLLSKLAQDLGV